MVDQPGLELRKKQAAARRKKGVVGSSGKNIPTTPRTRKKIPAAIKKYFFIIMF
jgi:hypothetical protein